MLRKALLLVLALIVTTGAQAAPVSYSFDFTSGGTESGAGSAGNAWTYWDSGATQEVTVTSWGDGGAVFAAATGHQQSTGLGVCNASEGTLANCIGKDNSRGLDNTAGNDWVLLLFSSRMALNEFTVFPDVGSKNKAQGRDVTFLAGTLDSANDILGATLADLTTSTALGGLGMVQFSVNNGKAMTAASVDVIGVAGGAEVWGNALLIGASVENGGDRFYLNAATTAVPIPAAAWLFLSALAGLFGRFGAVKRSSAF